MSDKKDLSEIAIEIAAGIREALNRDDTGLGLELPTRFSFPFFKSDKLFEAQYPYKKDKDGIEMGMIRISTGINGDGPKQEIFEFLFYKNELVYIANVLSQITCEDMINKSDQRVLM